MTGGPVILIHGGCGVIPRKNMTAEYEQECRDVLKKSLIAGYDILKAGGSALDAVMAAVVVMEDHPNFNVSGLLTGVPWVWGLGAWGLGPM